MGIVQSKQLALKCNAGYMKERGTMQTGTEAEMRNGKQRVPELIVICIVV